MKSKDKISIAISIKDHEYINRIKNKMNVTGLWVIVGKMVKLMKDNKLEGELK